MRKLIKLLLLLNIICILPLLSQGNLGQTGANFLQIDVDARAAGLGGAATAISSGAAALHANPAGIVSTQNMEVMFAYTDWFIDTKLAYGGLVKNLGNLGTFGLSISSFYMDEMEITSVYAEEGTDSYYEAGDISLGLSYGRQITEQFSFGVTAKYIHEKIWNETASQIGFDIGSVYKTNFYNLRLGMSILNISGNMEMEGDDIDKHLENEEALGEVNNTRIERFASEFRLPQVFRLGIAFDPISNEHSVLTTIIDVDVPSDNEQRVVGALEYCFNKMLFLRGAYKHNYDLSDYAFGVGFNLKAMGVDSRVDYSFSDHTRLGNVNRFGIVLAF